MIKMDKKDLFYLIIIVLITITSFAVADTNVVKHLFVEGNITGNFIYGKMWFHNDSATGVTTTINTQNVWENVTGFNQPSGSGQNLNGVIYDNTLEALKIVIPGSYDCEHHESFGNSGEDGILSLVKDDLVTLIVRDNDGTANVYTHSASVKCFRLGD